MKLSHLLPAAITLSALAASSCTDSTDGPTIAIYSNIVTFAGNQGEGSLYQYQQLDDSPVVELGIAGKLDEEKVAPGTRLLMTYSLPDGARYGESCYNVQLRGLQTVYTDTVSVSSPQQPLPSPAPIYLTTLYRSGHYLNFTTSMPQIAGRKYRFVADHNSLTTDTARLILTTEVPEETPAYKSTQTGSASIEPVWTLPGIKAVTVTVNNTNNSYKTKFIFPKQSN